VSRSAARGSSGRPGRLALAAAVALLGVSAATTPGRLFAQGPACDEGGWEAVVTDHLARYPLLGVEDAYKLVRQGVFGSEGGGFDVASASAALDEEILMQGDGRRSEALVEPIAPGGRYVRVHLRPYVAAGGDPEALLVAFLQTAALSGGSMEAFRCVVGVVGSAAASRWSEGVWGTFVERMLQSRLPAIQHSQPFESVYRPAYRVVAGDLLPSILPHPR